MFRTSAAVLALFLGSSQAVNFATGMNGDEDLGQDITMKGDKFHYNQYLQTQDDAAPKTELAPPEKVETLDPKPARSHTTFYNQHSLAQEDPEKTHVLQPTAYNDLSNKSEFSYGAPRTAFYAQAHAHADDAEPAKTEADDSAPTKPAKPAYIAPEKVHVLDPIIAREHTTFYDKKNGLWRGNVFAEAHNSPIARANRDPWVYEFTRDNMPPYDGGERADAPTAFMQRRNIGEAGYDEEVHGFVKPLVSGITGRAIEETPYLPNGSGPGAFPPSFFQHRRRNIGEAGYDEEVHGFVKPLVSGITGRAIEETPYLPNGSGPGAFPASFLQRRGINKEGVRPDVYDVVSRSVNPATLWRSDVPPEARHDGYWRYDGNSAFNTFSQVHAEPAEAAPAEKPAAAQTEEKTEKEKSEEEVHIPEKVHTQQPMSYEW